MFSSYTYANLKDDLTGLVGGTDLAKIQNLNQLVQRAGRRVIANIDPPTTKRRYLITLYDQVNDYSVPSDDDFKKAFDLRPQNNRSLLDNFSEYFSEQFDIRKTNLDALLSNDWRDGTQFFRIKRTLDSRAVTLNAFESLTANGTWAAVSGGGASNLGTNTLYKTKGSASVEFDVGATGGAIDNSTMTQVDLTNHDEVSSLFLDLFIPTGFTISDLTSVTLRWGNDSSNYWSRTITAPHFGSFNNGWNLLRFDWNGATETGTVDPATIDYVRITVTTTAADTDFKADNLVSRLGYIYELWYYSKFLFRTSSGTWQDTISDNADIINLDVDDRNLLVYECEDEMGKQLRDDDMRDEVREELYGIPGQKMGHYAKFKADHPSEGFKKKGVYYRI